MRRRREARSATSPATLGDKLGALLFQLPPNLKKDLALFDAFLAQLPPGVRAAFEFRHPSWFDDEVFERLAGAEPRALRRRQREAVDAGAHHGRLRVLPAARRGLQPDDIKRWADTIARETASCRDVFVYFKHEEEGKGPEFARLLMDRLGLPRTP